MRKQQFARAILWLLLLLMAFISLEDIPVPWFDEGWTLSLARNWVVAGHYGHLLMGEPVQITILNAGFPVIAPVALSFRLLGVGVWQGRFPGVLLTLLALFLLEKLTTRLYGAKVMWLTWLVVLGMAVHPNLHPIIMGRQMMGEMYVVFYLLAGFWALWKSWGQVIYLTLAMVAWGLALQAKPQTAPFLIASLVLPALLATAQKEWPVVLRLGSGFLGSLAVSMAIRYWEAAVLGGGNDPYGMLGDVKVLFTYVMALNIRARMFALTNLLLLIGIMPLLGLIYVGWRWLKDHDTLPVLHEKDTVLKVCLWVLGATWYYWFIGFSIGWSRYVFPAVILSSPFAARLFYDLTNGLDVKATLQEGAMLLGPRRTVKSFIITIMLLITVCSIGLTVHRIVQVYLMRSRGFHEVVWFLNQTADTGIETYESELYFLLEHPYHYPSAEVQHQLNQRLFFASDVPIAYEPLEEVDVKYLVIGFMSRFWGLDKILLQNQTWHLILNTEHYQVYTRID